MEIRCAWCDAEGLDGHIRGKRGSKVSHSICEHHLAKVRQEAQVAEWPREKGGDRKCSTKLSRTRTSI